MKTQSSNSKKLLTIFIALSALFFWAFMPKETTFIVSVIEFAKFHIVCFLYGSFLFGLFNFLNLNFRIWK